MAPGMWGLTGMVQLMGMGQSMAYEMTPPTEPLMQPWIKLVSADGVTRVRTW